MLICLKCRLHPVNASFITADTWKCLREMHQGVMQILVTNVLQHVVVFMSRYRRGLQWSMVLLEVRCAGPLRAVLFPSAKCAVTRARQLCC